MSRNLSEAMDVPRTEGVKYAGSKLRLLPFIVQEVAGLEVSHVLDAFTGTTRVAQAFSQLGYHVTANDTSVWSEVFGNCYLLSDKPDSYYQEMIDHLNGLKGYDGWFSENYGGVGDKGKMPFQLHNTRKLDAVREEIDRLDLEWVDKCVILTSLILALDAVDNTLGHFVAYLSGWSARSKKEMKLRMPRRFPVKTRNRVLRGDVFDAIKERYDLVYFDPPYGSNNEKMPPSRVRYNSYYHLWKTIILNDRPVLFGKAHRREDSRDTRAVSVFEEYRKTPEGKFIAMQALERMIAEANAHYVLLSYSSGGRATKEELHDIISAYGRLVSAKEIDYRKNVMAGFTWTNEWLNDYGGNKEYLFLMEK